MHLIDSSVWINAFNGNISDTVQQLLLSDKIGLTSIIYAEVLQGIKYDKQFNHIKDKLAVYQFYTLQDPKNSYQQAAQIYRQCRKKGITISSIADCLIAQCAIESDLILLHSDQDFVKIASVIPEFKQTIC